MRIHPLCVTCTCPDHLDTWTAQAIQATGDPADVIPTVQAYQSYLTWWFDNGKPQPGIGSSNQLTRRLRLAGYPIARRGSHGNSIIGYRLAS